MQNEEPLGIREAGEDAWDSLEAELEEQAAGPESEAPAEEKEEDLQTDDSALDGEEPEYTQEPISPPESWSAEAKALFNELPQEPDGFAPWAQRILKTVSEREAARDSDYHRKSEEMAGRAKFYDGLDGVFAPDKEWMDLHGITPERRVQDLINAQRALNNPQTRMQAFAQLGQLYGIDPRQLVNGNAQHQGAPGQPQGQPGQPMQPQTNRELLDLRKQVAGFQGYIQAQELKADKEVRQRGASLLRSFKTAKDDAGNLLRPHWEEVSAEITPLAKAVKASNPDLTPQEVLQQAYDKACRANDSVFKKLQEADAAAKRREAETAAKKAKKKGRTVRGKPQGTGTTKPTSIREAAENAAKGHNW